MLSPKVLSLSEFEIVVFSKRTVKVRYRPPITFCKSPETRRWGTQNPAAGFTKQGTFVTDWPPSNSRLFLDPHRTWSEPARPGFGTVPALKRFHHGPSVPSLRLASLIRNHSGSSRGTLTERTTMILLDDRESQIQQETSFCKPLRLAAELAERRKHTHPRY